MNSIVQLNRQTVGNAAEREAPNQDHAAFRSCCFPIQEPDWDQFYNNDEVLPYGDDLMPAWIVRWWGGCQRWWEKALRIQAAEFGEPASPTYHTIFNWDFRDVFANSRQYGPYCRLYAFSDENGQLHYADLVVSGLLRNGDISVQSRYRFKDLMKLSASSASAAG
jgi:hypothetical protein